jgi:hypothetical protein
VIYIFSKILLKISYKYFPSNPLKFFQEILTKYSIDISPNIFLLRNNFRIIFKIPTNIFFVVFLMLIRMHTSLVSYSEFYCRRFETGGPSGRRVSVAACPSPDGSSARASAKGGEARRPEAGVREVGIPWPSCSSRAQVGCACSRGLQASTRVRERAASKRAPVSSSSPRGRPSLRGPWSFLL